MSSIGKCLAFKVYSCASCAFADAAMIASAIFKSWLFLKRIIYDPAISAISSVIGMPVKPLMKLLMEKYMLDNASRRLYNATIALYNHFAWRLLPIAEQQHS